MTIAALAPFRTDPVRRPVDDDFSRLYRQYRPQLLRYVTHHFGTRDADEITQEALTRALRAMDRDRSEAETWAWLVRVARNVAHDLARTRRICDTTDDGEALAADFADEAVLPEPAALLDEKRRLVRRALKTLPPSQRRILVLYEVDELNCPAIARLIGSTEDAVRKALQRARRRFASEVRALGGGSLGSIVVWLRRGGLKRTLKATPAASASTALVAFVGVAVTVSVSPSAPERLLSPSLTAPVSVSAPDVDHGRVGGTTVHHALTASGATAGHRAGIAPRTSKTAPEGAVHVPLPPVLDSGHQQLVRVGVDTPYGRVGVHMVQDAEGVGTVCSVDMVWCEYEGH